MIILYIIIFIGSIYLGYHINPVIGLLLVVFIFFITYLLNKYS